LKTNLIGKRIVVAKTFNYLDCSFGETGEVKKVVSTLYGDKFFIALDKKNETIVLFEHEIYFQDSESGYNQKCFQ